MYKLTDANDPQETRTVHYRVQDVARFPTVRLSDVPITQRSTPLLQNDRRPPATPPSAGSMLNAEVAVYNHNFDDIGDELKSALIMMLLETLPSLREMSEYLVRQKRVAEPNLRAWSDRISPAALGLLRWIVASNRSCIVQVDECPVQKGVEGTPGITAKVRLDQRISKITNNFVQFRFAQGAPDKEQRFLSALKDNKDKLNSAHPTLFAWHGSPLQNWHSIIRSGLDFKETLHGRAYGHGVYHAMDQNTSMGYAQKSAVSTPKIQKVVQR